MSDSNTCGAHASIRPKATQKFNRQCILWITEKSFARIVWHLGDDSQRSNKSQLEARSDLFFCSSINELLETAVYMSKEGKPWLSESRQQFKNLKNKSELCNSSFQPKYPNSIQNPCLRCKIRYWEVSRLVSPLKTLPNPNPSPNPFHE